MAIVIPAVIGNFTVLYLASMAAFALKKLSIMSPHFSLLDAAMLRQNPNGDGFLWQGTVGVL